MVWQMIDALSLPELGAVLTGNVQLGNTFLQQMAFTT